MKIKNLKYFALPTLLAIALSGCFGSSSKDERIVVPPDPVVVGPVLPPALDVVVTGNVVDIDTINVIESATISFREGNAASQSIATVDGDPITQYVTEDGSFSFTLRDGASPDVVSLLVSAEGYFTKRFDIDFTTDEDEIAAELGLLTRVSEDTADAAVEEEISGGTTGEEITAAAENENAAAEATVPQGTQLLTASGTTISGSSVTLRVGAINSNSTAMGASVPAGLGAGTADAVVTPVGVVDVTMSDNQGNSVKRFSNPITVGLRLPADTMAPSGDRTIQPGDEFDLSSFDEDLGVWSMEDNKAVVGALNDAGTAYRASFQTDHLTLFAATNNMPVCQSDFVLNLSGDQISVPSLQVVLVSNDFSGPVSMRARAGQSTFTIPASGLKSLGASSLSTARIIIRSNIGASWYDSEEVVQICGGTVNAELTNPNPAPVNKVVNVFSVCSNDTSVRTRITGAVVSYRESGAASPFASAIENSAGGYDLVNLNGQASGYTVKVNPRLPGVAEFTRSVSANSTTETLEFNVQCRVITGTGS